MLGSQVLGLVDVASLNLINLVGHQHRYISSCGCTVPQPVHSCLHGEPNWIIVKLLHSGTERSRCFRTWPRWATSTKVNLLEWLHTMHVRSHLSTFKSSRILEIFGFLDKSLHLLFLQTNQLINVLVYLLQAYFTSRWSLTLASCHIHTLIASLRPNSLLLDSSTSIVTDWARSLGDQVSMAVLLAHQFIQSLLFCFPESLLVWNHAWLIGLQSHSAVFHGQPLWCSRYLISEEC